MSPFPGDGANRTEGDPLTEEHRQLLHSSAVDLDVAIRAGVRSVIGPDDLPPEIAWCMTPGLLFPWRSPDGTTVLHQYRPDEPGEGPKYLRPKGDANVLWVHPDTLGTTARTPNRILFIEGTKQFLSAFSAAGPDDLVVGLAGCLGWVQGGVMVSCASHLPIHGTDCFVLFDADYSSNRPVWDAADNLAANLRHRGAASVRFAHLGAYGTAGLDDVLAMEMESRRRAHLDGILADAKEKLGRAPAKKKETAEERRQQVREEMEQRQMEALLNGTMLPPDDYFASGQFDASLFSATVRNAYDLIAFPDGQVGPYVNGQYINEEVQFRVGVIHEHLAGRWAPPAANAARSHIWDELAASGRLASLDPHPGLINFRNGMVDIRTGELRDHSPDDLSIVQLPIEYDDSATCDFFMDWLEGKVGADQVDGLLDGLAEMFLPGRLSKPVLFLYGASRSGKGTLLRLCQSLLGRENYAATTLTQLVSDKFAAASLYGKMACIQGDLSSKHLPDLSVLKQLSGDDDVEAQRKYGHSFTFRNRAVMVFAGNEPPTMTEESAALLNRFLPIYFSDAASHAGHEDRDIEVRLQEEAVGLARLLVERAGSLLRTGSRGRSPLRVMEDFAGRTDAVHGFILANYRPDPSGVVLSDDLWRHWQRDDPSRSLGRNRFLRRADALMGARVKATGNRNGWRGWSETGSGGETGTFGPLISPASLQFSSSSPHLGHEESVCEREVGECEKNGLEGGEGKNRRTGGALALDIESASATRLFAPAPLGGFIKLVALGPDVHDLTTSGIELVVEALLDADKLVLHNGLGFDLIALAVHLGLDYTELARKTTDTELLARIVMPPSSGKYGRKRTSYRLDDLGESLLGLPKETFRWPGSDTELTLKAYGQRWRKKLGDAAPDDPFEAIPADDEQYRTYAARDVEITQLLVSKLRSMWPGSQEALADRYYAEREVAIIAARMTMAGLGFDHERARQLDDEYVRTKAEADTFLRRYAPDVADDVSPIRSPAGKWPIGNRLVELGVDLATTPKSGIWQLTSDTVRPYADEPTERGEIASAIIAVQDTPVATRLLHPAKTAFLPTWVGDDGRIHTRLKPSAQNMGRWSSTEPSMLNISKRKSEKKERDRGLFIAGDGHVLVSADLGQIDARAVAYCSGDEAYSAIFIEGRDIHSEVAEIVFGDRLLREKAKPFSHGLNYGMSVVGVMRVSGLDESAAETIIERLRDAYPRLVEWQDDVREEARFNGYVTNPFGRRVIVNFDDAHTGAPAALGQSTTTDVMNRGLRRLASAHPEVVEYLRLQIHDELLAEVPEDRHAEIAGWIVEALTAEPLGDIPVVADINGPGRRWSDL